jgi:2-hydroxy-6-oxonona-2,4-dienedioate hydrolase
MFAGLDRLALRPVRVAARAGRGVLAGEAERVVDGVLAGPLPEAVARSVVAHRVIGRVASEVLETASPDGSPSSELDQLVEQVLRSPALEAWMMSDEAGRVVDRVSERVLRSPALRRTIVEVVSDPELRRALSGQASGFGAEVASAVRVRGARADDAVEAPVHRLLRLRRRGAERGVFAGFGTRGLALVIDACVAQLLALVAVGSILVVASLVGASRTGVVVGTLTGVGWVAVVISYFAGFWSSVGQTPGMRLLGVRVVTLDRRSLSLPRALVRFVGLLLAIAPAFAGFLPALVDRRRRALQDLVARTVVLYDEEDLGARPLEDARQGADSLPASLALPPTAPSPLRSVWADVQGVRMHALAGGEGAAVVLVHGFGVSGTYMIPLARALLPSASVLVPDLPGQGESSSPQGRWGIPEMADALGAWLASMGVSEPLLVANSMGCQVVTELAVRRPDLAGPMVLVGPTVDPARRAAPRQLTAALRDSAREPWSLFATTARERARRVDLRVLLATARATLADRIEDRLPLIERPTVVVYGEDDGFVGREWAERATSLLPRGRLVVVPSEPHAVHYTRPDLVAGVVRDLLVEEREHRVAERLGRLEHRDVPARKPHDLSPRNEPAPVLR